MLELSGSGICVGSNDNDTSLGCESAVWHESTAGDVGSNLQGEEGFAATVIAIEQSNACKGETLLPKPANGLERGLGKIVLVDRKGGGQHVDGGFVCFEHFFEFGDRLGCGFLW